MRMNLRAVSSLQNAPIASLLLILGGSASEGGELAKLTANNAGSFDRFGQSVAMTEDYLIVGAHQEDTGASGAGSVYLYDRSSRAYLRTLQASDAGPNHHFGWSLAAEGGSLLVGAPGNDSGACYLFDLETGAELGKILPSDPAPGDQFGHSVAISDNHLLVGAWLAEDVDNNPSENSGAAYLFDRATRSQLQRLRANDISAADQFGGSVALGGGLACVGSLFSDQEGGEVDAGSVYLFSVRSGAQIRKVISPNPAEGDVFGSAIAASNGQLVVGAPEADEQGVSSGAAYLYQLSSGAFLENLVPLSGEAGDRFGWSVAIGQGIAVGAYRSDGGSLSDAGSVHCFSTQGQFVSKHESSDQAGSDFLGYSVAVEGGESLVGAIRDDDAGPSSGSAYLFSLRGEPVLEDLALSVSGDDCVLSWVGSAGASYQIFTTLSLDSWPSLPLDTIVASSSSLTFTHLTGASNATRFYRVIAVN